MALTIILTILAFWMLAKTSEANRQKKAAARRQAEIERIAAEQRRMRDEQKRQAREQAERDRAFLRLQREQERQAREQERQAEILRTHDERIEKLEHRIEQAEEDILQWENQRQQLMDYQEYLERERDACVGGSSHWHKWNNKCITNNNKVYALDTRIRKAYYTKEEAQRKIESEAA